MFVEGREAAGVAFVVALFAVVVAYLWWKLQDRNGGQPSEPVDNASLRAARLAKFSALATKASPGLGAAATSPEGGAATSKAPAPEPGAAAAAAEPAAKAPKAASTAAAKALDDAAPLEAAEAAAKTAADAAGKGPEPEQATKTHEPASAAAAETVQLKCSLTGPPTVPPRSWCGCIRRS